MDKETEKVEVLNTATEKKGNPINQEKTKEVNGRKGLEPTRYGDWEKNGRCIDF